MADNNPTKWSYSKKPPISNNGTLVDARLSTITPDNPRGYVRLSTTSNDSIINGSSVKLYYAIDNNGTATYADIDDQGNIRRQYNNIQEIASAGKFGYTPQTTLRIKDSLQTNLEQRTEQTILSSIDSPVAPTAPTPPQQGPAAPPIGPGGTPSAPQLPRPGEQPQTAELTNISVAGSGLRYPKLMKIDQDKIKFQACKISRSSSSITSSPKYDPVDGPVFLAIQSPISDQNSVDWGPDSVNAIDAKIYDKSLGLIQGQNPNEVFNATAKEILNFGLGNTALIQKFLAGQAASLNNVLARTDNVVLNPNLELLFQGPQLRPFSFQFKMSARSQDEAYEIKKIIKYFKYHMAVRKETGLFLRAPHVFTIRYLKREIENHPGINLISPTDDTKACALTNCSVDYTPLGSYATYEDGTMAAYTLSLQFQEITPIYDTDYAEGPAASHPIGY